eukprot:1254801-Pyramimonas_sp.AAC.1
MSEGRVAVDSDQARGRVGHGVRAEKQSQQPIPRLCQNRVPRSQGSAEVRHVLNHPPPCRPEQ